MGMPSTAVRGAYAITPETGNAGYEPPWAATLDLAYFEEVELARLQERLRAEPALEASIVSAEAVILRVLEGDDPETRGDGNGIAQGSDSTAHGKRSGERSTSREVALLLLATLLATSERDDGTEQGRGPEGNGSLEGGSRFARDVGTYSHLKTGGGEEYVPTCYGNVTEDPGSSQLTYLPPSQSSRPEWQCVEFGSQYNSISQPAGSIKRAPYSCKKCENCIRYRIDTRPVRYAQSLPGPLQTILTFTALDPTEARKFASNRQHSRRLPGARRYSQLSQEGLSEETDGTSLPCDGLLLWDGEMDHSKLQQVEAHAKSGGMYNVNAYVTAVDEDKFRGWLPSRLTLFGRDNEKLDATHFGRGWAKELKPEKDGRDGRTRVKYVPDGEDPVTRCSEGERAKAIRKSWRPYFESLSNPTLTPQERAAALGLYIHHFHRARYINWADWLYCMSPKTLEATKLCIEMRLKGEKPNLKYWRTLTDAPETMIHYTAEWLMGKRAPEPAITLVGERLGFISMWREPHIDPDFLAELTDTLPPLLSVEAPRDVRGLQSHAQETNQVSNNYLSGHTCAEIESHTGSKKRPRRRAGTGASGKDTAHQRQLPINAQPRGGGPSPSASCAQGIPAHHAVRIAA